VLCLACRTAAALLALQQLSVTVTLCRDTKGHGASSEHSDSDDADEEDVGAWEFEIEVHRRDMGGDAGGAPNNVLWSTKRSHSEIAQFLHWAIGVYAPKVPTSLSKHSKHSDSSNQRKDGRPQIAESLESKVSCHAPSVAECLDWQSAHRALIDWLCVDVSGGACVCRLQLNAVLECTAVGAAPTTRKFLASAAATRPQLGVVARERSVTIGSRTRQEFDKRRRPPPKRSFLGLGRLFGGH